jgi:NADPH-dependent 2,4-dienoyl-CoA reductase/sulfur reductase-like enzyme
VSADQKADETSAPVPGSVSIVGAGIAGHFTAKALRKLGYTGRITMIGAEQHRPYDRPPLSKEYLLGTLDESQLSLERRSEDLGVNQMLGTEAVSLDPESHTVTLGDGSRIFSDAVVLATGSRLRRLPAATTTGGTGGTDPAGIYLLRTLDDARALRSAMLSHRRLVVIGAGFIGSEIASAGHQLGLDVTILEAQSTPLSGVLGAAGGTAVAALHSRNGVVLRPEAAVAKVHGTDEVTAVELVDGELIPADLVAVGIGVDADIGWLHGSGLDLSPGAVACDDRGRTAVRRIYAVGDCAAWWDPVLERHQRIEHWTEAMDRPSVLAAAMLGEPGPTRLKPPYFWSDLYGSRVEFVGRRAGDEEFVVEDGSAGDANLLATYRRDGEPVAVLGVNQIKQIRRWRKTLTQMLPDESGSPGRWS